MSDVNQTMDEAPPPHQEHAEIETDRMRVGVVGVSVFAICLLIVGLVAFADQYFRTRVHEEVATKLDRVNPLLHDLRAQEEQKLHHYQWVDQKAGVVRVPVERAMQLVIDDYAKPLPPPPAAP